MAGTLPKGWKSRVPSPQRSPPGGEAPALTCSVPDGDVEGAPLLQVEGAAHRADRVGEAPLHVPLQQRGLAHVHVPQKHDFPVGLPHLPARSHLLSPASLPWSSPPVSAGRSWGASPASDRWTPNSRGPSPSDHARAQKGKRASWRGQELWSGPACTWGAGPPLGSRAALTPPRRRLFRRDPSCSWPRGGRGRGAQEELEDASSRRAAPGRKTGVLEAPSALPLPHTASRCWGPGLRPRRRPGLERGRSPPPALSSLPPSALRPSPGLR